MYITDMVMDYPILFVSFIVVVYFFIILIVGLTFAKLFDKEDDL